MSIVGPFQPESRMSVNGYQVPFVTVSTVKNPPEQDGLINLIVDHRFAVTCTEEELEKWAPILANAMAVSAGYSCHGENCEPLNRFKTKLVELSSDS